MREYRSRPTVIRAMRWMPEDMEMAGAVVGTFMARGVDSRVLEGKRLQFHVLKGNSNCIIDPGDWIIEEPDGQGYYPCAAEVFEAKYEPAEVDA